MRTVCCGMVIGSKVLRINTLFPFSLLPPLPRLPRNVPSSGSTTVIHGDFRIDNLIYAEDMSVRAVLDWELSTLGDPWCDLAQNCLPYHFHGEMPPMIGMADADVATLGIPDEGTLVQRYCHHAGVANLLSVSVGASAWLARTPGVCMRLFVRLRVWMCVDVDVDVRACVCVWVCL